MSTSEQFEWDWHHIQTTYKDFKKGELYDSLNDMDFTDVDQNHKWQKGGIAWNDPDLNIDWRIPKDKINRLYLI